MREDMKINNSYLALGVAAAIGAGSTFALSKIDLRSPESQPKRTVSYVVKSGDTLDSILFKNSFKGNRNEYNLEAVRYEVKLEKDGKLTELPDYNRLDVGDVLQIPVYYSHLGNKVDTTF